IDGLVIARPQTRFSAKDLFVIDQFLLKGGRLMCFIDELNIDEDTLKKTGQTHTTRYDNLKIDDMLFDYGIKINPNYIMDVRCVPMAVPMAKQSMIPWFFNVLASSTNHPISRNLEPVALNYTNELQFVNQSPNVALTPILTSSTNSNVTGLAPMISLMIPLNYGKNPELVPNPESESNKKCIAALAEGMFKSHFRNRIVDEYAKNPAAKLLDSSRVESKIFVIGNG